MVWAFHVGSQLGSETGIVRQPNCREGTHEIAAILVSQRNPAMITTQQHLSEMQRYVAKVGMTPSALRNLGAKGFVKAAIDFLSSVNLAPLVGVNPSTYPRWLDAPTNALMAAFPIKLWGPARKAMNIFMVMASLNIFLRDAYGLGRFDDVLEVPLDNIVEGELRKFGLAQKLFPTGFPQWDSIKNLDPPNSAKYQQIAQAMASQRGIPRGRLDVALF